MHNIKGVTPDNIGWLEVNLSKEELVFLWDAIDNKKEDIKDKLVGHVKNSYRLEDRETWFFDNVVGPLCNDYAKRFKNFGHDSPLSSTHPFYLQSLWVNYQSETEFNPLHFHSGVYSFVIWMKIPTSFTEQEKLYPALNEESVVSCFKFEFVDMLGGLMGHKYKLSPEMEGKMLLFPSKLNHIVYPFFNCKEDRISISGNVFIDTSR